jgi:hypothetical protein
MSVFKALDKQGLVNPEFKYNSLEDTLLEQDIYSWRHEHRAAKITYGKDMITSLFDFAGQMFDIGIDVVQTEEDAKKAILTSKLAALEADKKTSETTVVLYETLATLAADLKVLTDKKTSRTPEENDEVTALNEVILKLKAAVNNKTKSENDIEIKVLDNKIKRIEAELKPNETTSLSEKIDEIKAATTADEALKLDLSGVEYTKEDDTGLQWRKDWKTGLATAQFAIDKAMSFWSTFNTLHADDDGYVGSVKAFVQVLHHSGNTAEIIQTQDDKVQIIYIHKRGERNPSHIKILAGENPQTIVDRKTDQQLKDAKTTFKAAEYVFAAADDIYKKSAKDGDAISAYKTAKEKFATAEDVYFNTRDQKGNSTLYNKLAAEGIAVKVDLYSDYEDKSWLLPKPFPRSRKNWMNRKGYETAKYDLEISVNADGRAEKLDLSSNKISYELFDSLKEKKTEIMQVERIYDLEKLLEIENSVFEAKAKEVCEKVKKDHGSLLNWRSKANYETELNKATTKLKTYLADIKPVNIENLKAILELIGNSDPSILEPNEKQNCLKNYGLITPEQIKVMTPAAKKNTLILVNAESVIGLTDGNKENILSLVNAHSVIGLTDGNKENILSLVNAHSVIGLTDDSQKNILTLVNKDSVQGLADEVKTNIINLQLIDRTFKPTAEETKLILNLVNEHGVNNLKDECKEVIISYLKGLEVEALKKISKDARVSIIKVLSFYDDAVKFVKLFGVKVSDVRQGIKRTLPYLLWDLTSVQVDSLKDSHGGKVIILLNFDYRIIHLDSGTQLKLLKSVYNNIVNDVEPFQGIKLD